MFDIQAAPIRLESVYSFLASPRAGAVLVFTGTARDHNDGRSVHHLEYESYAEMALKSFALIAAEMRERWRLEKIAMIHRVGKIEIAEIAVVVGVSAAHRQEAFDACRYGIDALKADAPIWKKELFDGGGEWLANPEGLFKE